MKEKTKLTKEQIHQDSHKLQRLLNAKAREMRKQNMNRRSKRMMK
jgi:hypothetical protein